MPPPSKKSRAKFHRGRWELARERTRVTDEAPPPPARDPRALADGITALLKTLGPPPDAWLHELDAEWPSLVGPDVARHTRPAGVERAVLLVHVDSSTWLNELQRYGHKHMLVKLQGRFGANRVPALRLRLDPDGGRRPSPA